MMKKGIQVRGDSTTIRTIQAYSLSAVNVLAVANHDGKDDEHFILNIAS